MKNTLLILILCITTTALAQESTTKGQVVGKTEVVSNNPDLKDLAIDVNAKYTAYQSSITGSRSGSVETVQDDYLKSLEAYISALETEISEANDQDALVLKEELAQAKALRDRVQMSGSKSK
ncbi:MAG: hypothetical protein HUJ25_05630 [Crocinitomicaceae bacterium]|nr:hypothetical protein [Crocinitomicaceae bacterium]